MSGGGLPLCLCCAGFIVRLTGSLLRFIGVHGRDLQMRAWFSADQIQKFLSRNVNPPFGVYAGSPVFATVSPEFRRRADLDHVAPTGAQT